MRKLREAPDNYFLIRAGCASPSITFFSFAQVAQSSRQTFPRSRRPREVPDTSPLSRAGCASIQQRHAPVPLGTETRRLSAAQSAYNLLILNYFGGSCTSSRSAEPLRCECCSRYEISLCHTFFTFFLSRASEKGCSYYAGQVKRTENLKYL